MPSNFKKPPHMNLDGRVWYCLGQRVIRPYRKRLPTPSTGRLWAILIHRQIVGCITYIYIYHICIQFLYPSPPYLFGLPFQGEWRSRNATAADSLVAGRRAATPQRQRLRALLCPRGAMKRWVVGWVDKDYPYLRILWWLCNIVHLLKFEFYDYNILWDGLTVHGTSAGFSVWATGL